jgi:hypothetical protein
LGAIAICCVLVVIFFVGTTTIIALIANSEVSKSDSQTFVLESAQVASLSIDDPDVQVTIVGGSGNQVVADYVLKTFALSKDEAQKNLDKTTVNIQRRSDGMIQIVVDSQDVSFLSYYRLELTLQVPQQLGTVIITSQEDITIENVQAAFDLSTDISADVHLKNVSGSFEVSVVGLGEIQFTGTFAKGSANTFSSGSGDISLIVPDAPNIAYTLRTDSAGRAVCPGEQNETRQCAGTRGMGAVKLDVTSNGGDITLTIGEP